MMILLYGVATILVVAFLALIAFVHISPVRATEMALNATRKQSGLVRKEITLPDGQRYVYLEGGQGDPLMLLHGFGGNKDTFTRVARFLAKRYRVVIPDIPGFGESDRPADAAYSLPEQVERLRAFSKAMHFRSLHLGGNSMGAQIALLYSVLHPDEVASLWLISPAGIWSGSESDVIRHFRDSGRNPLVARNEQEFRDVMAIGMRRPPYVPKPMLKVLAQERIRNVALEERIFQQILDHSLENQIRNMKTPSLIVFGSEDRVIPIETANILNDLLPNSKVTVVQNAGHVAMFEKPRQCANDYLAFRETMAKEQTHLGAGVQDA